MIVVEGMRRLFLGVLMGGLLSCSMPEAPVVEVQAPAFEPLRHASPIGPAVSYPTSSSDQILPNDSLSVALARHQLGGLDVDGVVRALDGLFDFRYCRPGHRFELAKNAEGRLDWMRYEAGPMDIFHVHRDADGVLVGQKEPVRVVREVHEVEGTIEASLYLAMKAAGEEDALVLEFVDLFAWDIDFFTETQKNDRFRIVFEKRLVDGRFVGYGKILGGEYAHADGRQHRAFYYSAEDGKGGYYTERGESVKKAFLKSPIQFASITSRFGMRRHPILQYSRMHKGVDYGAPRGTAIWAVGDAVVTKAGRSSGYGNVVYLRHANGLETRYAHLHNFGKGIRTGVRVSQKQIIGYVGSTGLATGPHLHFEVLKGGRHENPTRMSAPPAPPIPPGELERFQAQISQVRTRLETRVALVSDDPKTLD